MGKYDVAMQKYIKEQTPSDGEDDETSNYKHNDVTNDATNDTANEDDTMSVVNSGHEMNCDTNNDKVICDNNSDSPQHELSNNEEVPSSNNNVDNRENDQQLLDVTQQKLKKLTPKDLAIHDNISSMNGGDKRDELNITTTSYMTSSSQLSQSQLPPCVEILQQFAHQHGFISGIPISAVDAKGGVHEAVQSLIRHLVECKRKRKNQNDTTSHNKKMKSRKINEDFEPLQDVGISEIDDVFESCNQHLMIAELLATDYRKYMLI